MLEGFYTAASGMLVQQRNLNVLSNNIANTKTPGFRVERLVSTTFEQELMTRMEAGNSGHIGTAAPMRVVEEVSSRFDPSFLTDTGRPYDCAIIGEGYFNIRSTGEEPQQYLTRNGNFDMDDEGYLILRGVGRVQGVHKGDLAVGNSNFHIRNNGEVTDDRGQLIDQLLLTMPEADTPIVKQANGLYLAPPEEQNPQAEGLLVAQGKIERSNIDINREYTIVMEAQRAFQSCSAALRIIDELNQKTATQIASVG